MRASRLDSQKPNRKGGPDLKHPRFGNGADVF
jgi:hypothetical protein